MSTKPALPSMLRSVSADPDASIQQSMSVHARTFSFAARFLPPEKRAATTVLYAFCREVDDLVDEPVPGRSKMDVVKELDAWQSWLEGGRAWAGPREPLAGELSAVIAEYGVPIQHLIDLLDGLRMDLEPVAFEEEVELHRYCYHVASTVGLGMAHVLGATSDAALKAAADLGAAMQRTNILRDVGEDLSFGRLYLPKNTLGQFDLTHADLLKLRESGSGPDERFRALMREEVARTRALYHQAMPGIWLLPSDCRLPILLATRLYRRILTVIERRGYDTLRRRASTSRREKIEEAAIALLVDRLWRRGEVAPRRRMPVPLASLRET